jgi:hypothetical protein
MRLLLVLAQQGGQVLDKRREMQGGRKQYGRLTPLYNYYAGVQGQPCDLALPDTYKKRIASRRDTRRASAVDGRLQWHTGPKQTRKTLDRGCSRPPIARLV